MKVLPFERPDQLVVLNGLLGFLHLPLTVDLDPLGLGGSDELPVVDLIPSAHPWTLLDLLLPGGTLLLGLELLGLETFLIGFAVGRVGEAGMIGRLRESAANFPGSFHESLALSHAFCSLVVGVLSAFTILIVASFVNMFTRPQNLLQCRHDRGS